MTRSRSSVKAFLLRIRHARAIRRQIAESSDRSMPKMIESEPLEKGRAVSLPGFRQGHLITCRRSLPTSQAPTLRQTLVPEISAAIEASLAPSPIPIAA